MDALLILPAAGSIALSYPQLLQRIPLEISICRENIHGSNQFYSSIKMENLQLKSVDNQDVNAHITSQYTLQYYRIQRHNPAAAAAAAAADTLDELLRLLVVEQLDWTSPWWAKKLQFVSIKISSIHTVDLLSRKESLHRNKGVLIF